MESPQDNPRVFVPPPLLIGGTLLVGLLIDGTLASPPSGGTVWQVAGAAVAFIGIILVAASLGLFRRARTRPAPWQPASTLISSGLYRITRNPMYLGMLLMYGGIALALRSPVAGVLLLAVFVVMDRMVVAREEAYLRRRFGEAFTQYCSKVRRWL